MAVSAGRIIQDGGNIMLFIDDKSVAHSSSHHFNISSQTEEINTKDCGEFGMTTVSQLTWEITADHFYTKDGYDTFFTAMTSMQPIDVVFGLKAEAELPPDGTPKDVNVSADGNWTKGASYYYGKAIISSLDWTATKGSKSVFSATLSGQGAIQKYPAN